MGDILDKLGSYITAKDSRLACAAAVILTELAPKDSVVTRQLAAALETADAVRRPYIIEALGRIGTPEAAAALVPLIKSEGSASEQALRAIAHTASAALKPLLALVGKVPANLLERLAECVARTGDPAAFSTLMGALAGADIETCKAIRAGLRVAMTSFDDKNKERLLKALEKAFHEKPLTQHHPALIALIKISGDLGAVSLQSYVVDRISADYPPHVRRAALKSIAMLHYSGEQRAKLAQKILPLLGENDLNLAEPALEAIRQAHLGSEHQALLRKLLNSPSSKIREFAMQTLATHGTSRTMSELIACMDSPDRHVREEALGALSRSAAAAGALCERLMSLEGGDAANETARALAPQAVNIPRKLLEALAEQFVSLCGESDNKKNAAVNGAQKNAEKRRAILAVFRAANSPALVEAVYAKALKIRKDEPEKAYELLRTVSGLTGWDDSHKIEMALTGLSYSPKDLTRSARATDQNLRALEEMLSYARRTPKDLARIVEKDSLLNRKTLYYLGFHFVERMQSERQFGQMILEQLAVTRSDEARQAKEKLIIEGLAAARSKAGILEERAKVMMTTSDMIAAEREREDKMQRKPAQGRSSVRKTKPAVKRVGAKGGGAKAKAARRSK